MANIAQKSNIHSNAAFSTISGSVWSALKNIDKVLISQGAANARIRKIQMLNAKSDEELAKMGLDRENIICVVFRVNSDI